MDKRIEVINKDCFDFLPTIGDNSINLILIDPPYLISRNSGFMCNTSKSEYASKYGKYKIDFGEWDKTELPIDTILKESYRILKPSGTFIMFFDIWKMGEVKREAENCRFKQPRLGCWNKTNPVPINSKINYLSNAKEFFVTFVKKSRPTFNSEYDNAEYYYDLSENDTYFLPIVHGKERLKHPTQKPLKLFEDLISKHSNEGDVVIDFFAGTGTTGVACRTLNRKCILCESNSEYVDLIKGRLKETGDER